MISQLHGTLVEATMSSAVVDVSGVGFELGISGHVADARRRGPPLHAYAGARGRHDTFWFFLKG